MAEVNSQNPLRTEPSQSEAPAAPEQSARSDGHSRGGKPSGRGRGRGGPRNDFDRTAHPSTGRGSGVRGGGGRGRGRGSGRGRGRDKVQGDGRNSGENGNTAAQSGNDKPADHESGESSTDDEDDLEEQEDSDEEKKPKKDKHRPRKAGKQVEVDSSSAVPAETPTEAREKRKQPYVRQVELPKEKLSAADLDAKMAAMALTNAKLLERKEAADKDAAEYEEIERESCKKVGLKTISHEARRLQQAEIDEARRLAAERKLGKVQGREWDREKTDDDWNRARPYVDSMTIPEAGAHYRGRDHHGQGMRGGGRGRAERGRPFRGRGRGSRGRGSKFAGNTHTSPGGDWTQDAGNEGEQGPGDKEEYNRGLG
ncbi:hypothetical protein DFH28DRAFT_1081590 [Melampsora americana]|nr:hypothetical protein DFH28DRAFT_1081590 [Melampsora americana]